MTDRLSASLAGSLAGSLAACFALAACASSAAEGGNAAADSAATVRMGEEVRLEGLGVRALRLVEDSRCPAGVQCIRAGTVRLAVRLSEVSAQRETIIDLNAPTPLAGGRYVRLVAVCPAPGPPGPRPPERAYSFVIAAGPHGAEAPPERPCGPA